jgi:tetratricopeptide (TPR) repeat protein
MLPTVEPEERIVHAIGTLRAYAFVTKRPDTDSYDMHRLVHLATKVWLDKQKALQKVKEEATIHLAEIFPSNDYTNRATWREYFPHAFQSLRITKELVIKARFDLCTAVGRCLLVDGRVGEAVVWLSECCSWWQGHFPEDHPDRLASQHQLAIAYQADGQVLKAVKLLEQVVAIEEKVLKEDHPSRLASQHELAIAYRADGQVLKAVKLLEQVVAIEEKMLKEDHPNRLASQQELLSLYTQQRSEGERQSETSAQYRI